MADPGSFRERCAEKKARANPVVETLLWREEGEILRTGIPGMDIENPGGCPTLFRKEGRCVKTLLNERGFGNKCWSHS
jgi:hypothetical protein